MDPGHLVHSYNDGLCTNYPAAVQEKLFDVGTSHYVEMSYIQKPDSNPLLILQGQLVILCSIS